jgi:hypothetical protein
MNALRNYKYGKTDLAIAGMLSRLKRQVKCTASMQENSCATTWPEIRVRQDHSTDGTCIDLCIIYNVTNEPLLPLAPYYVRISPVCLYATSFENRWYQE